MNSKNLWIAALSGAAVSLLVTNLPYIGFINCLLCAGFWGSALFAVWLYRRLNGTLTVSDGAKIGALSGLIAWAVGFLLSFVGLAGIQGLMSGAERFLPADATKGMQELPTWAATLINFMGILLEVIFGAIGGWIGGVIFRTDSKLEKQGEQI